MRKILPYWLSAFVFLEAIKQEDTQKDVCEEKKSKVEGPEGKEMMEMKCMEMIREKKQYYA